MSSLDMKKNWILLRGLAREVGHWGVFLQQFQQKFPDDNVIAVDLPGVGGLSSIKAPSSIRKMMLSVREQVSLEQGNGPYHILALSLGGMIAIDWMDQFPSDIAGAVIVNSSSQLSPFYRRLRWESWKEFLAALSTTDIKQREERILNLISNSEINRSEILSTWIKVSRQSKISPLTAARQLFAASQFEVPQRVLTDKALFVVGLGDRLVEPECTMQLARHFQAPVVGHSWGGHDLPIDDPHWLLDQIGKWLQTA